MDNTNTPALTQADLDRAVAQARTEAHAAGAEAGAKAEADRMTAILGLPEAKGREGMAQQLAKTPGMTAEAAKAILDAAPKAAAIPTLDQRAEGIPHVAAAGTGSADKQAEIDKGWDAIISAENEARGLKPPRLGGFR